MLRCLHAYLHVLCVWSYTPNKYTNMYIHIHPVFNMGWLRLVGCLKIQVSFAKEIYKRDLYSAKRPVFLSILLIVATPYRLQSGELSLDVCVYIYICIYISIYVYLNLCVYMYIIMCARRLCIYAITYIHTHQYSLGFFFCRTP